MMSTVRLEPPSSSLLVSLDKPGASSHLHGIVTVPCSSALLKQSGTVCFAR